MTEVAVLGFFPVLMAFAALSDLSTMTISNRVSILLALGFAPVALLVGAPLDLIGLHFLCGMAVLGLTFAMFAFRLIGGGDAKLAAATAIWLGFGGLMSYGLVSALAGGVLTIALLALRRAPLPKALSSREWIARLHNPESGVPYGVALAAAGLLIYPDSLVWLRASGV